VPLATLAVVFVLIAVRRVGPWRMPIWLVMLGGALAVLATGQIAPAAALRAINLDVMLSLFGLFVVGHAMEDSGYLSQLSYRLFRHARSTDALVILILVVMGLGSALLMNDTIAIVGTPIVLYMARAHGIAPRLLLHALMLAVTTGGAMSPLGNPQNLLVAVEGGLDNPFVSFGRLLSVPTLIGLALAYLALRLAYARDFHRLPLSHQAIAPRDPSLAALSRVSLILVVVLILAKIALFALRPLGAGFDLPLTAIALAAAAPVLLASPKRFRLLAAMDWPTLVFFAAMFVLMRSVWDSGLPQWALGRGGVNLASLELVMVVAVVGSQLVSNVPLVALLLPMIGASASASADASAGVQILVGLAAASTISGNLLILGAASNVIVIQNAERRTGDTVSFLEFLRVGAPLTAAQCAVYWGYLRLFS
jgi:Na+/H+ antiporter NhaD/arsenite permease-like protein